MVRGFCYLGDRVNACGGCEAAVTTRARIGWLKFRECEELLNSKRFSLTVKGMFYRSCVRVAMLYGSETWCLRENKIAVLRRTERTMVRAMCGAKLMERKKTEELMEMLGLKETVVQMGKANGVRWYGQVLRKALEFEVRDKRKRGRPKKTWKTQVEKQSKSVGLEKKDAMNRARWRVGVRKIADSRWRSRYYGLLHFLHLIALCHLETSRSLSEITGNQYGYIFNSFYQFCCDFELHFIFPRNLTR